MSTVPIGSIVFQGFDAPRTSAVARDVYNGERIALDLNGDLLSRCPSTALIVGFEREDIPAQTLSLNDGRVVMVQNNVINTYAPVGTRIVGRNGWTDPPIGAHELARVRLLGSDHVSQFFVGVESFDPYPAPATPVTYYLQAGTLTPTTGVVENLATVDSVTSPDATLALRELYGVCTDKDGVLYYIKGDNADPLLSTHTLYAYDTTTHVLLRTVAVYPPGAPYPLPCGLTLNFAFNDGSLCLVFGAQYGSVTQQCKRIHQVTGAVLATYLQTHTRVMVTPGLTDAEFWLLQHGVQIQLVNRATGATISFATLTAIHGTVIGFYTLLMPYQACVQPPASPVTRYIRRVRRFRLPFNQNFFLYINRFELLIQPGTAASNGQGSEPLIFVRFSGDGGTTWGPTIHVPAGQLGDYGYRPTINQIGKLRDPMCEVWVSDPIYWYMIGCYIDGEFAPG